MIKSLQQIEVLLWASSFLKEHHREEGIAEILLMHHLNITRTHFYQNMHEKLPEKVVTSYKNDIEKHVKTGIPVQHIIGHAPFYGRDFIVNSDVLIPRFETEELVEKVIQSIRLSNYGSTPVIVDVGTGSGIIAITLKLEIPDLLIYATDISPKALNIAKQNAMLHHADVTFLQGNFLMPIIRAEVVPNIIVSNPPYIRYTDKAILADTVKDFDPELALFAKEDGLKAYKDIISQSSMLPQESLQSIYFEIGSTQAKDVCGIIQGTYPTSNVQVLKDMNKNDRIVFID